MKAIQYIKIFLPVAVLVVLFAFRNYFLERMSQSISAPTHRSGNSEFFAAYDLSQKDTKIKGTLLEFGATNCSVCRQMEKVLREIENRFPDELDVRFINITEREGIETGREFGLIMIPMQVLLNAKGNVVFRHTGYIGAEELSGQINQYIISNP